MEPGASVGPYLIDRELGSGGMGTVYRAEGPDGVVALKVVHSHVLETEDAVQRFRREVEIGKTVDHPNVVRTFGGGEADGRHFMAMEYVEGQTLDELLDELERVPEELCRHIGREVCRGLAAIHAAGAVHRDMKPGNVLITPDHVVKIMDLGVALSADHALRLSQTGAFVGSLCYAAPEQLAGGRDLDARVDLHALGLVLYELACASSPYAAADIPQTMHKVLHEEPRRIGEINPQLSPFFEEVVHCLFAKDREGRFPSGDELLAVLDAGEDSTWWSERARALQRATHRPIRRIRIPRETAVHGREHEIAKLRALYARASTGDGNVVLIEGEAGIGKSRLVDELIGRLQTDGEDLNFLFGSYPPGGAATAEGGFSSAYREQFGEAGSAAYLPENQILVSAFDALLRGEGAPPDAQRLGKGSLQTCFVRATQSLAAERATIVLIEDLHFAPEEGRALFTSLAMSVPSHRVLLVGTVRPGVPEDWLSGLTRLDQTSQLPLLRLGPKDLVNLLQDTLRSAQLAREIGNQIAVKSDGNALHAEPASLDGALCVDLCDHFLRGTRGEQALRYLDSAHAHLRAGYLSERVASLLERVLAVPNLLVGAARVTVLLKLVPALDLMGRRKRQEEAAREAKTLADALGDDSLRIEASRLLGGVYWITNRPDEAEAATREALEIGRAAGDRLVEAGTTGNLGAVYYERGLLPEARAHHERALALYREVDNRAAQAGTLVNLANVAHDQGCVAEAREHLELALSISREFGDRFNEATATGNLGAILLSEGRLPEARERYTRYLSIAREAGLRRSECIALGGLGALALAEGRLPEAEQHFEAEIALCPQIGHRSGEATARFSIANICTERGELARAEQGLLSAVTLSETIGFVQLTAAAHLVLGSVRALRGDTSKARESLTTARDLAAKTGDVGTAIVARCELACLPGGDPADALAAFGESRERLDASQSRDARLLLWKATGDRAHLEACKRLLDEGLALVDDDTRASMIGNLRVHREIVAAWNEHGGDAFVD